MFNLRLFMLSALCGFSAPTLAVEVKITCGGPIGQELYLCKQAVKAWSEKTGHTATVVPSPQTTDQRYKKFSEQLKAGDASIDVYEMDVIWPGLLAEYFVDLRQFISEEAIEKHFLAIIENNYEGLMCNVMEWLVAYGCGTIIDDAGKVTINNAQAITAVD